MDVIGPVLDSIESTGGGWPVLVLVIVIASIVYLARYVLSRQIRINEHRMRDHEADVKHRMAERKQEFDAQLARERDNTESYRGTTQMMVGALDKNSTAMADFTSVLRPMADTLERLDHHFGSLPPESLRARKPRGSNNAQQT